MNNDSHKSSWLVVKTKPRFEKKVAQSLEKAGFEIFLPLQTQIRIWSDRKKKVAMPLIPSVVFIKNTEFYRKLLYSTPGFHTIIRQNGKPGIVTNEEIEHLRMLCASEEEWRQIALPSIHKGQDVEIISGLFKGLFAKAVEAGDTFRILLEIEALRVGFLVNMGKNRVRVVN